MHNYGERLKAARKAKGLTQTELATILGLTQGSYQRMETGNHDLKMSTIYQLCKALNISSDWLIGLSNNTKTTPAKKEIPIYDETGTMITLLQIDEFGMVVTANDLIGNKPIITARHTTQKRENRG